MKRIVKFETGNEVPEGSIFLSTVVEKGEVHAGDCHINTYKYVWHYFLVEVNK